MYLGFTCIADAGKFGLVRVLDLLIVVCVTVCCLLVGPMPKPYSFLLQLQYCGSSMTIGLPSSFSAVLHRTKEIDGSPGVRLLVACHVVCFVVCLMSVTVC